jgi:hypothetical protein
MRQVLTILLRVSILLVAVGVLLPESAPAGIRIDGTESQSASFSLSTSRKDADSTGAEKLVFTFGQALLARGELFNPNGVATKIGIGYEYNVRNTSYTCSCPNQGDADTDARTTALDLAKIIDALFAGAPNPIEPTCPTYRYDWDCDGQTTPLDLAATVDYLFANGSGPCKPCAEF